MNKPSNTIDDKPSLLRVAGRTLGIRNIVIFAPLLTAAVFSFSYMQMQSMQMQQTMADSQTNQIEAKTGTAPALPLVVQPALPQLETTLSLPANTPVSDQPSPETGLNPGQFKKTIGPSSSEAAKALQGVGDALGGSKNDDIQATRKQIRLDQIDIVGL